MAQRPRTLRFQPRPDGKRPHVRGTTKRCGSTRTLRLAEHLVEREDARPRLGIERGADHRPRDDVALDLAVLAREAHRVERAEDRAAEPLARSGLPPIPAEQAG